MANGNRVTVTTGYNRGGYYRKVTVRRPDGTAESRTDQKNIGLFNTGLLDMSGPYSGAVPKWAGGTEEDWGWGTMIALLLVVLAVFLFFGWPWLPHWTKPTKIAVASVWYVFLIGGAIWAIAYRRKSLRVPAAAGVATTDGESLLAEDHPYRNAHLDAATERRNAEFLERRESGERPTTPSRPPAPPPQVLGTESIWPQRFTDSWFRQTGPFLSAAHALELGKELRRRGWSDEEITERVTPHVPFRVI